MNIHELVEFQRKAFHTAVNVFHYSVFKGCRKGSCFFKVSRIEGIAVTFEFSRSIHSYTCRFTYFFCRSSVKRIVGYTHTAMNTQLVAAEFPGL